MGQEQLRAELLAWVHIESRAILAIMCCQILTTQLILLQVVVHNLPWNTTWQQLKDAFVDTGVIERADVIIDSSGRSR